MQVFIDLYIPIFFAAMFYSSHKNDTFTFGNWKTIFPLLAILGWTLLVTHTFITKDKGSLLEVSSMWICFTFAIVIITLETVKQKKQNVIE